MGKAQRTKQLLKIYALQWWIFSKVFSKMGCLSLIPLNWSPQRLERLTKECFHIRLKFIKIKSENSNQNLKFIRTPIFYRRQQIKDQDHNLPPLCLLAERRFYLIPFSLLMI